jgi:hypothetical protein
LFNRNGSVILAEIDTNADPIESVYASINIQKQGEIVSLHNEF